MVIRPQIARDMQAEAAPVEEEIDIPAPQPVEAEPVMSREEAEAIAQGIIEEAQAQAAQLLDEAAEQAQGVREQAWQEGYTEGKSKAEAESSHHREEVARSFAQVAENLQGNLDAFFHSMEKDILGLSVDIARKIVHTEIDSKDEAYLMLVQNALNHMKSEGGITIRMGPDDYAWYGEAAERFLKPSHSTTTLHVVEDPMLLKGSCILESEGEAINAGIETQLSNARLALMEEADIGE